MFTRVRERESFQKTVHGFDVSDSVCGAMARVNPAELPGSMAILGLVIEEPNQTVSRVAQRLERRFARSRFSPSTAYNALPQMARRGQHPPRVRCTQRGHDRSHDRYEATPEGVEAFRAWMLEMPSGAPALREALYGRIELCRMEDVPRLILIAREEGLIATDLYSAATTRLKRLGVRPRGRKDYLRRVRETLLYAEPMHWSGRAERYEEIAKGLEEIALEAGLELLEARDGR